MISFKNDEHCYAQSLPAVLCLLFTNCVTVYHFICVFATQWWALNDESHCDCGYMFVKFATLLPDVLFISIEPTIIFDAIKYQFSLKWTMNNRFEHNIENIF